MQLSQLALRHSRRGFHTIALLSLHTANAPLPTAEYRVANKLRTMNNFKIHTRTSSEDK